MSTIRWIRRDKQRVPFAPGGQHDEEILRFQPKQDAMVASALVCPHFDAGVGGVLNDGSEPADAFTPAHVRNTVFLDIAFLDDMPKGPFPVLIHGVAPQSNPHT